MHKGVRNSALNRSLPLQTNERGVKFIQTYAQQHRLILPGRIPGVRNYTDALVLSSSTTKLAIYEKCVIACQGEPSQPVSLIHFWKLWNIFCRNIVIQKPRSDLCVECQTSIITLGRMQNLPEDVKQERIAASLTHLDVVQ